jgi:hypothetical protein
MAKAKHTNAKHPHQDSASKNTMNPPTSGGPTQSPPEIADQAQDPKRRFGQYGGKGEHHINKY